MNACVSSLLHCMCRSLLRASGIVAAVTRLLHEESEDVAYLEAVHCAFFSERILIFSKFEVELQAFEEVVVCLS